MNNHSNITQIAVALSIIALAGVVAAPAVLAHPNSNYSGSSGLAAHMKTMHQNLQHMRYNLNHMFSNTQVQSQSQTQHQYQAQGHGSAQHQAQAQSQSQSQSQQAAYGKMKYAKKKPKNETQQAQNGSIRVCKVLVNHQDSVIRGTSIPGAQFSIMLKRGNANTTASFTTPLSLNTDLVTGHTGNDAACKTYTDLPMGTYQYSQESVSGNNTNRVNVTGYNDRFHAGTNTLANVYSPGANNRADGQITLTTQHPDRTLVVKNTRRQQEQEQSSEMNMTNQTIKKQKYYKYYKYAKKKPVHVKRGSLRVCKVLIDENNTVLTGENMSANFSTTLTHGGQNATVTFSTPLNLTSDLNGDGANDAECARATQLPLGTYHYSAENITNGNNSNVTVLGYNDNWVTGQSNESQFYNYSANQLSDGKMVLSAAHPNKTLVMLNQQLPVTEQEQGQEQNMTPTKKKVIILKKYIPYMQHTQGQQAQAPHHHHRYVKSKPSTSGNEAEQSSEPTGSQSMTFTQVQQTANSNIQQNANAHGGGTTSVHQEANSNIQQNANVNTS